MKSWVAELRLISPQAFAQLNRNCAVPVLNATFRAMLRAYLSFPR
jgi:hypothetical protein